MPASVIYVNNAATSYPKPPEVVAAVQACLQAPPADSLRGGGSQDVSLGARQAACELFDVPRAEQIVLSTSGTAALNIAIFGTVSPNSVVAVSSWEHNSVTRPLTYLASDFGVTVEVFDPLARAGLQRLVQCLERGASVVVMSMSCNATGCILPFAEVAEIVARRGATLVLDASQAAGCLDFRYSALPGRVFVAMSGHKALLGPPGTAILIVPDALARPHVVGGTGAHSSLSGMPTELPLRYEAGTPNTCGIAGLAAGLKYLANRGITALGRARSANVLNIRQSLNGVSGVRLVGVNEDDGGVGIMAFTVDGWDPTEFAVALQESFSIHARGGLQCAPWAHQMLGTYPRGTVRVSVGSDIEPAHVDYLCRSVRRLASREGTPCS
jgi:cysteine desulfurase / selenocysteine lyase